jgi:hypothetical protein
MTAKISAATKACLVGFESGADIRKGLRTVPINSGWPSASWVTLSSFHPAALIRLAEKSPQSKRLFELILN